MVQFCEKFGLSHSVGPGLLGSPGQVTRYALTQGAHTHNGNAVSGNMGPNGPHGPGRSGNSIPPDLATLAESIAQALPIIQAAGLNAATHLPHPHSQPGESYDPSYCSVKLPPPQPLAPIDSAVLERYVLIQSIHIACTKPCSVESGTNCDPCHLFWQTLCCVPSKSTTIVCS